MPTTYKTWADIPEEMRHRIEADAKVPGLLEFYGQIKELHQTYDLDKVADLVASGNWIVLNVYRHQKTMQYIRTDNVVTEKSYEFVLGRFR